MPWPCFVVLWMSMILVISWQYIFITDVKEFWFPSAHSFSNQLCSVAPSVLPCLCFLILLVVQLSAWMIVLKWWPTCNTDLILPSFKWFCYICIFCFTDVVLWCYHPNCLMNAQSFIQALQPDPKNRDVITMVSWLDI